MMLRRAYILIDYSFDKGILMIVFNAGYYGGGVSNKLRKILMVTKLSSLLSIKFESKELKP